MSVENATQKKEQLEAKQDLQVDASGLDHLRTVKGIDFDDEDFNLDKLLDGMLSIGGQATLVGEAREMFKHVCKLRQSTNESERPIVYLSYTSNMVSSGLREIIRYLCQNKLVDVVVTSCGGIEEDFMKCKTDTFVNYDYVVDDKQWRREGKNRIGNMIVPNNNYVVFEEWVSDIYPELLNEQKTKGIAHTASDLVRILGERIEDPNSIYYWCAKNGIPVFCPAITDGSFGDIIYCKGFADQKLILDLNADLQRIMTFGLNKGRPLCAFLLGAGMVKYHVMNACKIQGGLDMGIFISVGNEFDNSCSGAKPKQDQVRGAIKQNAKIININYDASIIVPLIFTSTTS